VIIASVPHSGSRFLQRLLGWKFLHVYDGESLDEITQHELIAVPLRHPIAVAESWKRRGKPIAEHPKHEPMVRMFRNLIERVDPLGPIYLPLDNGHREAALLELGLRTGRLLATDWRPVTDDIEFPAVSLTEHERAAVTELMADPFFERVGYSLPVGI
jgi:hypothetical protein